MSRICQILKFGPQYFDLIVVEQANAREITIRLVKLQLLVTQVMAFL